MDLHTSNLFRLVRKAAASYRKLDGSQLPKPWREASEAFPVEHVAYVANGVDVPAQDDDSPVRPKIVRKFLELNNSWAPKRDKAVFWSSPQDGRNKIKEIFGKNLPEPSVIWPDSGVALTEDWARQGLGAHHLEKIKEGGQAGEVYVSSFEYMSHYQVRDGLATYGGALYLTADMKATRIRLRGKDVRPTDADWEAAAFAYRSSSLVATTFSDHVFRCHYVLMNTVLLAVKRYLPLSHPLRHFIAPFHYRTAAINNGGAVTLVPEGGMFHRTGGYTWKQQREVYNDCVTSYRFETFEETMRRRGVHPDDLGPDHAMLFPYASDGMELWRRIRAFTNDALDSSPALSGILGSHKAATEKWWKSISDGLPGGLAPLNEKSLRDFLSQVIFTVTGFHEHVGNVSQYIVNPALAAGKLWPNQTVSDMQSSMQLCVVGCITGLPMPKLLEDFGHLMPDKESTDALHRFQAALGEMQTEVDARNAKRRLAFTSFCPNRMSCSVSI